MHGHRCHYCGKDYEHAPGTAVPAHVQGPDRLLMTFLHKATGFCSGCLVKAVRTHRSVVDALYEAAREERAA